jgi:putative chitinase
MIEKLKGHIPEHVYAELPTVVQTFGGRTPLRLAHFLAQCAHESGNFTQTVENLNYSGSRLRQVFPKYFPGNLAESYKNQPGRIGARVYANRMGNGDEISGEGFLYRGRGYIQLTGKFNYKDFDNFVVDDILDNPDLVATKYPLASAAWFFNRHSIWTICDKGDSNQTVTEVTRKVNGGVNGLEDRLKHFKKYYPILK